jgi:hypothetical protein
MYLPLIAIFIAISGGMGISYMAEDSLPGDPLYPVKVRINENVRNMVFDKPDNLSGTITARATSSESVFLEAKLETEESASIDLGNSNASATVDVYASTSLNANQVINAK